MYLFELGYPKEPFEWGLPAAQIWCFWLLHDWRYRDFQTGNFANFEQFTIDSHFSDFGQVKIDPSWLYLLLWAGHSFIEFWARLLAAKNNPNPLILIKKSRTTHRIWPKSFSMTQSAGIKNWLGSPLNKWTSKAQSLISFCNTFFWFVQQNKIYMLRIMMQKVLHNWGNIFWVAIF